MSHEDDEPTWEQRVAAARVAEAMVEVHDATAQVIAVGRKLNSESWGGMPGVDLTDQAAAAIAKLAKAENDLDIAKLDLHNAGGVEAFDAVD